MIAKVGLAWGVRWSIGASLAPFYCCCDTEMKLETARVLHLLSYLFDMN